MYNHKQVVPKATGEFLPEVLAEVSFYEVGSLAPCLSQVVQEMPLRGPAHK